jgi:hypothetical protein
MPPDGHAAARGKLRPPPRARSANVPDSHHGGRRHQSGSASTPSLAGPLRFKPAQQAAGSSRDCPDGGSCTGTFSWPRTNSRVRHEMSRAVKDQLKPIRQGSSEARQGVGEGRTGLESSVQSRLIPLLRQRSGAPGADPLRALDRPGVHHGCTVPVKAVRPSARRRIKLHVSGCGTVPQSGESDSRTVRLHLVSARSCEPPATRLKLS